MWDAIGAGSLRSTRSSATIPTRSRCVTSSSPRAIGRRSLAKKNSAWKSRNSPPACGESPHRGFCHLVPDPQGSRASACELHRCHTPSSHRYRGRVDTSPHVRAQQLLCPRHVSGHNTRSQSRREDARCTHGGRWRCTPWWRWEVGAHALASQCLRWCTPVHVDFGLRGRRGVSPPRRAIRQGAVHHLPRVLQQLQLERGLVQDVCGRGGDRVPTQLWHHDSLLALGHHNEVLEGEPRRSIHRGQRRRSHVPALVGSSHHRHQPGEHAWRTQRR